jgi:thioredoxin-related protein
MNTGIVLLAASILLAVRADALELLMFRRVGCPWCAAWDREIGPAYPKTEIGRRIAIRFIDLDQSDATRFKLKSPVRITPTFVLTENNGEIGRIEGYPGADFFWGRLERLVPDTAETAGEDAAGRARGGVP